MTSAPPIRLERSSHAKTYAAWLEQRNGRLGADGRMLERREAEMRRAELWDWPDNHRVSREAYELNLCRQRPPKTLGRATLWALCLAKASAAESFGASVGTNFGAASDRNVATILAHIEAEEAYHARVARCLLTALGLHALPPPPDRLTRALVRAMAWLPEPWGGSIVVYTGELTAAALFRLLRVSLDAVFEARSPAHRLAERLLDDVILDEEAHARFAASRMRALDRTAARTLLPHIVRLLRLTLPEAAYLFAGELPLEIARVEQELASRFS